MLDVMVNRLFARAISAIETLSQESARHSQLLPVYLSNWSWGGDPQTVILSVIQNAPIDRHITFYVTTSAELACRPAISDQLFDLQQWLLRYSLKNDLSLSLQVLITQCSPELETIRKAYADVQQCDMTDGVILGLGISENNQLLLAALHLSTVDNSALSSLRLISSAAVKVPALDSGDRIIYSVTASEQVPPQISLGSAIQAPGLMLALVLIAEWTAHHDLASQQVLLDQLLSSGLTHNCDSWCDDEGVRQWALSVDDELYFSLHAERLQEEQHGRTARDTSEEGVLQLLSRVSGYSVSRLSNPGSIDKTIALDSLIAVELATEFQRIYGKALNPNTLLDRPTLGDLLTRLTAQLTTDEAAEVFVPIGCSQRTVGVL